MLQRRIASLLLLATVLSPPTNARAEDLGDLLVKKGIISQQELDALRTEQQQAAAASSTPTRAAALAAPPADTPPVVTDAEPPPPASSLDLLVKNAVQRELPAWMMHFRLSTLIYMDWAYYLNTGYGPQLLTQITPPGPGNDGFNSFDITRTYINLFWYPSDRFTIRVTPNIFREVSASSAVNTSNSSQVATNVNGNLSFRLKYGYLQINNIFKDLGDLSMLPGFTDTNVKVGQIENPLIPWEEDLYGYRFVNLVPLNFLAYSSTDLGVAVMGPVVYDGTRYMDYWFGYYNGSSFHSAEFNENRSPQGRVSAYPLAMYPELQNLGGSFFMSYGYSNVAPDTPDATIRRLAALVHYNGPYGAIAFEYDRTYNQNNFNNFFTGAAPRQMLGNVTNPLYTLYNQILSPTATGEGYNVFGHVNFGTWPFSAFGMWQRWYPNLSYNPNPLDFDRVVGGVAWQPLSWMRMAIDSQNIMYFQSGRTVPQDTHAIFTNLELNY